MVTETDMRMHGHVGADMYVCVCKNTSSSVLKIYRAYYMYVIPQIKKHTHTLCWSPNVPSSSNWNNWHAAPPSLEQGGEIDQLVVEG